MCHLENWNTLCWSEMRIIISLILPRSNQSMIMDLETPLQTRLFIQQKEVSNNCFRVKVTVMVFNATFNNILVVSRRSDLSVGKVE
jgi:hypothetical protein